MSRKGKSWLNLEKALPSPFAIAILLTLITIFIALLNGSAPEEILLQWSVGVRNPSLLTFAFQMMLMLVLGHCLALSAPVSAAVNKLSLLGRTNASAAFLISFFTILVALFNWGLGLVFGAVFARKMAESLSGRGIPVNYGLLGAAGYSGMMVWHGGLSGSAPLKAAEPGHFLEGVMGVVPVSETLFSGMNLIVCICLLLLLPFILYRAGKSVKGKVFIKETPAVESTGFVSGAEHLDHSRWFILIPGLAITGWQLYSLIRSPDPLSLINPDFINLLLLGACMVFHKRLSEMLRAVEHGMPGAAGILIQFPLYFGIMGIMAESGLISQMSDWFVSISNGETFPILTLASSALVNIFVPSGGGQWAVQGPVIAQAAMSLNVPVEKAVMALAYGDQLTNMLQPFWALPLLGITGLKAKEILPYSLLLMIAGIVVFTLALLLI